MKRITLLVLVSVVLLYSCNNNPPSINIISPANGQVFHNGDTVRVKATLYDNDALRYESLIVAANTNDTIINFNDYTLTDDDYHLSKKFVAVSDTQYQISIEASGQGTSNKTIYVTAD